MREKIQVRVEKKLTEVKAFHQSRYENQDDVLQEIDLDRPISNHAIPGVNEGLEWGFDRYITPWIAVYSKENDKELGADGFTVNLFGRTRTSIEY